FYAIGKEIEEKERAYNELRDYLSAKYPILASFSDLKTDPAVLAQLTQGPGPEMAGVIAAQIADTLSKIQTSRDGLDEPGRVNVWRLPKMVGLTRAQLAVDGDAVKKSLVDERVSIEQPGILDGIALLVLNIAALLLAGPTGGLSLVAAAGVNAYLAYEHVQDYIVQDAMAGSAFHQAQAISQDEPSLFWLAVEIIGVGIDVVTAMATVAKAFRALAPLVKVAETAEE